MRSCWTHFSAGFFQAELGDGLILQKLIRPYVVDIAVCSYKECKKEVLIGSKDEKELIAAEEKAAKQGTAIIFNSCLRSETSRLSKGRSHVTSYFIDAIKDLSGDKRTYSNILRYMNKKFEEETLNMRESDTSRKRRSRYTCVQYFKRSCLQGPRRL